MRALLTLTCLGLAIGANAPVLANDSSAELSAGGIVLTKNSDIEMLSEDLYVSAELVRVKYVFYNRSNRDVDLLVAFPMPDVAGSEEPLAIPTEHPTNLLAFRTIVNGRPVNADVEQRAFVGDIEHTQFLRSLGIPLAPHLKTTMEALTRLPQARWLEFERRKIAEIMEWDEGQGMRKHLVPRWTVKTTWHWRQTFPANAPTHVEHSYKPATGESAGTSLGSPNQAREDWFRDYQRKYCMDSAFLNAMNRARVAARQDFGAPYTEQRISYILTTGANWAGPIRDFRLVVDKGAAKNIVSFCGEGVKRISPTQFEMRRQNFIPTSDLHVLIMKPQTP